ncbi:MAG: TerC family protein [Phycisphaerales bacterium]|nr:TerC family protein [Phycisphaerales bacterium]
MAIAELALLAQEAHAGASLKPIAYGGFLLLVLAFLALDLGVFHKEAHVVSLREASMWSAIWVCCALAFGAFVYYAYNGHWLGLGLEVPVLGKAGQTETVPGIIALKQYLAGYVVEKSLSMDNVFVIAIIFAYFKVPAIYQHRVLFWGILGALVMRGVMILIGAELVKRFDWILIFFGLFLVFTAIKMALVNGEVDPEANPLVRFCKRLYPVTTAYHGQKFLVVIDGVRHATPLALALVMVEATDVVFAVDSIPAIFGLTADPFIVFTSNIFAILGLRALYFCLAALIEKFRFLKPSLVAILLFVGVKLLLLSSPKYLGKLMTMFGGVDPEWKGIHLSTTLTLSVVMGLLGLAIVASLIWPGSVDEKPSPDDSTPAP